MRLICPNCDAQYEVAEGVIPEAGRDVQCSSCGHAWFQKPVAAEAAPPPPPAELPDDDFLPDDLSDTPGFGAAGAATEAATEAAEAAAAAGAGPTLSEDYEEAAEGFPDHLPAGALPAEADAGEAEPPSSVVPTRPEGAGLRRRPPDESVLAVLREEAEREAQARRAEGSSIETQPDLGLVVAAAAAAASQAAATGERSARLRSVEPDDEEAGAEAAEAAEPAHQRSARRDLLPDIDQINSTLRATSERGSEAASVDAPETLRQRRSGFRMGFSLMLVLAALALALYVLAPRLAQAVPAMAPALASYVEAVDEGRLWLDAKMQSTTAALRGEEPSAPAPVEPPAEPVPATTAPEPAPAGD